MPARPEIPKCSVACNYCRLKKAKCTGSRPCTNCVLIRIVDEQSHREQCVFPDKSSRRKTSHSQTFLERRIASLEQLLWQHEAPTRSTPAPSAPGPYVDEALERQPSPISIQPSARSESSSKSPSTCRSFAPPDSSDNTSPGVPTWVSNSADVAPSIFDIRDLAASEVNLSLADPVLNLDNEPNNGSTSAIAPTSCENLRQVPSPTRQDAGENTATSESSLVAENAGELRDGTPPSPMQEGDIQEHIGTITDRDSFGKVDIDNVVTGKASFLTICSPHGVEWICQQLGNSDFHHSASRLTVTITRSLKMTKPLSVERQPDPDYETALLWATGQFCDCLTTQNLSLTRYRLLAFFEDSIEHTLGLVPRQAFERRLQQHYSHPLPADSDPPWYSLRNTVFAVGSRIALCRGSGPMSYTTAQRQSWLYFENALAVLTNLLYMPSDITAVECTLLMALYCEAISAPSLEYMLLSTAVRLAYSKRLHLQPPSSCILSESEKVTRNWLLWVLYMYDKHVACRSGRPSMIRDDDINVALPTKAREDTSTDLGLLLASVRHAQISYAIERECYGTKFGLRSIEEICKTIERLDAELRSWYADLGQEYLLYTPKRPKVLHPRISHIHFLFLQHCFHGSMCVLHSAITQPWRSNQLQQSQRPEHVKQIQESCKTIAESSRVIVLNSQKFPIDATTPSWLVFYFPILATMNLFLNTVRSPNNPSAQSDITLIDIVAGTFARLDYASSGHLSISFPREVADYARTLVSKSREQHREPDSRQWTSDLDQLFNLDADMAVSGIDPARPFSKTCY
ncbi:putative fungal specific transcription protein [Fonsecaea pedrosoi]|nr:putative fungal specific transcription protein [Fonsecaea pedrosoi]